ncbi:LOW QUALITY PROTEIN: mesenchyme-specific cell surface glycoprotein-like [Haliotis rubra]|uniref:LOW QUALITY PROTEIN: mesenchyme-specific cell surface glycoprotein-like n=1 Tax=Haliotis rubra TaxID=36100 RepID=UPI001EE58CD6|nr:LOW QUALITY PROTEIN: mesenchyme-specific cell surface glycoprotein-like [Haliotis rubra]
MLKLLMCLAVGTVTVAQADINVRLRRRSTLYLPYTYQNGPKYDLFEVSVEQVSYDSDNKILYTVGDTVVHAIDVSDPNNMKVAAHLEYPGMEFTDVEFCGGHIFTAMDNRTDRANGKMIVLKYNPATKQINEVLQVQVGAIPDMVKPTKDCKKIVVAVEGEAYEYPPNHITDPPGLVVIVNFPWGIGTDMIISTLDFERFNDRVPFLAGSGVRHAHQANNNPLSHDVEPEYIAINADDSKAYIMLQENNAVATVDLETQTISEVYGLGYKNWSSLKLDPSDKDGGAHMNAYNVYGMYQPDTFVHFQFKGGNYLVLANEGDSKDYSYGGYQWSEESRGSDIPPHDVWRNIDYTTQAQLGNNTVLGRLKFAVSPAEKTMCVLYCTGRLKFAVSPAEKDSQGFLKDMYVFGGRGWSIRRAEDMSLIYDSGNDIAERTLRTEHDLFNCEIDNVHNRPVDDFDTRSDDKGPETESVAVGEVDGYTLFFAANERPGTIFTYSVKDDLSHPKFQHIYSGIPETRGRTWQQMYDDRDLTEIDCEDMKFVHASKSPTGKAILFVGGSVSGTLSILDVEVLD